MSSIAAPIHDTFSSEGSKQTQKRADRTAKMLKTASMAEVSRGIPIRRELVGQTKLALEDPGEAAQKLLPFSNYSAEVLGGQLGRQRDRQIEEMIRAGVGLGQPGAANALFTRDTQAAQAVADARLAPVRALFNNAPTIGQMGMQAGLQGLASAAGIQASLAGVAGQRAKLQSETGGEIFGILGGIAGS